MMINSLSNKNLLLLNQLIKLLLGNLLLCSLLIGDLLLANLLNENLLSKIIEQKNHIKAEKGNSRHFKYFIESGIRWNPINVKC